MMDQKDNVVSFADMSQSKSFPLNFDPHMCKSFVGDFFSPVRIIVEMDALLVRLSPGPVRPPLGFALVVEKICS